MKKYIIVITAALALVLAACSPQPEKAQEAATEEQKAEIIHNTAEEFESYMQGEYLLLDCKDTGRNTTKDT